MAFLFKQVQYCNCKAFLMLIGLALMLTKNLLVAIVFLWQCFGFLVFKETQVVSTSYTNFEYCALANSAAESLWIRSLLQEIHFHDTFTPILWCDNILAQALASNPVLHSRSKHIKLDVHFIWTNSSPNNWKFSMFPHLIKQLIVSLRLYLTQNSNIFKTNLVFINSYSHSHLRGIISMKII